MRGVLGLGLQLGMGGGRINSPLFYVREDGSAIKVDATGPSSDAAACMSIATFNGSTFDSGDTVYFSSKGGNITTAAIIPSSDAIYTGEPGSNPTFHGGGTVGVGLQVASKNNVNISNMTFTNHLVSGVEISGTSSGVVVSSVVANNSGNQGFQMEDTASAVFNSITGDGNTDDGFSMHGGTAVINGGVFTGNSEGMAIISNSQLTANDITCSGNTLFDVDVKSIANINLTNFTGDQSIVLTTGGTATFINAVTSGSVLVESVGSQIDFNQSEITNKVVSQTGGTFNASRSLFYDAVANHSIDVLTGSFANIKACILYNVDAGKYLVTSRAGATVNVYNSNLYDTAQVGNGIFADGTVNFKNNILNNLNTATRVFAASTTVFSNVCIFGNLVDYLDQTPTDASGITTDPLFVNPVTDFSLGDGSDCIGAGVDITGVTIDFNGESFNSPPSIGAIEKQ